MYVVDDRKYAKLLESVDCACTLDDLKEAVKDVLQYLNMREIKLHDDD